MSPNKRNRKTKKTFDYEGENTGCTRALEDARESFRIGTYLPIIDILIAEVRRRKSVYCILQQNFNFLLNLNTWAISDIENAASKLLKVRGSYMQTIWIATFLRKLCTSLFIYAHLLILVRRQMLRKHSCHI